MFQFFTNKAGTVSTVLYGVFTNEAVSTVLDGVFTNKAVARVLHGISTYNRKRKLNNG